jgi:hypothetical protein
VNQKPERLLDYDTKSRKTNYKAAVADLEIFHIFEITNFGKLWTTSYKNAFFLKKIWQISYS